jgi:hypothetical protein
MGFITNMLSKIGIVLPRNDTDVFSWYIKCHWSNEVIYASIDIESMNFQFSFSNKWGHQIFVSLNQGSHSLSRSIYVIFNNELFYFEEDGFPDILLMMKNGDYFPRKERFFKNQYEIDESIQIVIK